MKKILFFLSLTLGLLFAATPKDTIVIGVENEQERLNPLFSEDHDAAVGLIFSGLMRFDENMKAIPDIAKSYSVSEDKLVYDFVLREDVYWHYGTKLSAKDVKFTLDSLLDEKLNAPTKPNFNEIKAVEITGEYSIRIRLKKTFAPLLDALSVGLLPEHILKGQDLSKSDFNQNPIGTGPYKLKEWKKGQYKILEVNENFYLTKVANKKLILRTINDPAVASLELKAGKLDAALVSFEYIKDFERDLKFSLVMEKSADYRALMFNMQNPLLQDLAVRKALNYAVDKKALVEKLLHGLGEVAAHPLQNSYVAPQKFSSYEYNPQKAEELLQKAGWTKNKNGIYSKDNKELSFEIYAMSNDPLRVAMTNYLVSEFKKIGVLAKGVAKPAGSFDYSAVDGFLVGWGSPYDPDFHTYRVFGSFEGENDFNFGHYKDAKVDSALKTGRNSLELEKRKKAYADFIEALYQNPPFLFLAYLEFPLVYNKDIKGVKTYVLGHHGVGFTYNAYEWSK